MGTCKTRDIQADRNIHVYSSIFRHIKRHSGIIRYIQKLFKHILQYWGKLMKQYQEIKQNWTG